MNRLALVTLASASVLACAIAARAQDPAGPMGMGPSPAAVAAAAALPTPRTANGHPDLSGVWSRSILNDIPIPGKRFADGSVRTYGPQGLGTPKLPPGAEKLSKGDLFNVLSQQRDAQNVKARAAAPNQPPYKPELVAKVKANADKQIDLDGTFYCRPAGVPRIGPPSQIVQSPGAVTFLYEDGNTFRVIPTDGRAHRTDDYHSYMGDSVGHWEGDTLVVDVNHLTDETWLNQDGTFHSDQMHVIERLRREGNVLHYNVTVEDPVVFTRPWEMNPRTLILRKDGLEESEPCEELDRKYMVNYDRH